MKIVASQCQKVDFMSKDAVLSEFKSRRSSDKDKSKNIKIIKNQNGSKKTATQFIKI